MKRVLNFMRAQPQTGAYSCFKQLGVRLFITVSELVLGHCDYVQGCEAWYLCKLRGEVCLYLNSNYNYNSLALAEEYHSSGGSNTCNCRLERNQQFAWSATLIQQQDIQALSTLLLLTIVSQDTGVIKNDNSATLLYRKSTVI